MIQINQLLVKMKGETLVSLLKKLDGLKPKMYSFLLEYSNEHKKEKGVIKMLLQQQSW